FEDLRVSSF
nr:Chain C, NP338-L7S peptide [unidentified influenza virus]